MNIDWVVGGYFNAKALELGADKPDSAETCVMKITSRLGLIVINKGPRSGKLATIHETIVDVSFTSEGLATFIPARFIHLVFTSPSLCN